MSGYLTTAQQKLFFVVPFPLFALVFLMYHVRTCHSPAGLLCCVVLSYCVIAEAEPHPAPVKESDVNVMQALAMGNTCPYMPTTFREFLKVAVDLGRAVKPTSTNNSTVTEDLAAAARAEDDALQITPTHSWSEDKDPDHDKDDTNTNTNTNTKGGDNGDQSDGGGNAAEGNGSATTTATATSDGAGAGATEKAPVGGPLPSPPPAPAPARLVRGSSLPVGGSSSSSSGAGAGDGKDVSPTPNPRPHQAPRPRPRPPPLGEEGMDNGEDELGVILPSFAPKVRAGPSRMTSAPALSGSGSRSSSIGSGGGGRRRRSSRGSSIGSQGSFDLVDGGTNDRKSIGGGSSEGGGDANGDSDGESMSFFGVMSSVRNTNTGCCIVSRW